MKQLIGDKARTTATINSRVLLRFALIAAVIGILGLTALQYLNKRQKAKLSREFEGRHGMESSFALSMAKAHQQEALTELRKTTNLLDKLRTEFDQLLRVGEALRSNGAGPQVAAWAFFTNEMRSLPTKREIQDKVSQIDPAIFTIETAQGTPYMPDGHLISDAKQSSEWASTNLAALSALRLRLSQILTNATMEAESALASSRAESRDAKTNVLADAKAEAERTIAETKAEAGEILAQTKAEAARILEDTRAEAMRILAETRDKAEAILASLEEKGTEAAVPKAPEVATELTAKTPMAKEQGEPPNQMVQAQQQATPKGGAPQFREVIADTKLRRDFQPFTTPGNMRLPGQFRVEKSPISLNQLKAYGALKPTMNGLERLVKIASTPQDAVRPAGSSK